jgi:BirA family biotin operon repressor/biotin-[acetyl-CoA-carboxylase] ligase
VSLDQRAIEAGLPEPFAGRVEVHGALASTIDRCRELAEQGARAAVVVAEEQAAGRGQPGHGWHSPPGGAYLSALVRPPLRAPDVAILAPVAGLAACEALRGLGVPCHLKLPNDLVAVHGGTWRKLGGMLVDTALQGDALRHAIVSVGVNVAQVAWPETLRGIAVACADLVPDAPSRERVIASILVHLDAVLREAASSPGAVAARHAACVRCVRPGDAATCDAAAS